MKSRRDAKNWMESMSPEVWGLRWVLLALAAQFQPRQDLPLMLHLATLSFLLYALVYTLAQSALPAAGRGETKAAH